jgi:protein TonB
MPDVTDTDAAASRRVWRALGASLFAHLMLFGWMPGAPPQTPPTGNTLSATLRPPAGLPEAAPDFDIPLAPKTPLVPEALPAKPPARPRPLPEGSPRAQEKLPRSLAAPAQEAWTQSAPLPSGKADALAEAPASSDSLSDVSSDVLSNVPSDSHAGHSGEDSSAGSGTSALAGQTGEGAVDGRASSGASGESGATGIPAAASDALRDYRIALGRSARAFKRYPALARERSEEGQARIRLSGGTRGVQLELEESSGHLLLDRAALSLLREAVRHTPLPEALLRQPFSFVLAIEYNLEK